MILTKSNLPYFLGVTANIGSSTTFWYLPASTDIVMMRSITPLTADKLKGPMIKQQMINLDKKIQEKSGDNVKEKEI